MYKFGLNRHFFLKLTTAEEAYFFMMLERDPVWKDLALQDVGSLIVMYALRKERDADYTAMNHVMKR